MIFPSPDPAAGAVGVALDVGLGCLVDFLTPPTGAAFAAFAAGRRWRRAWRRELTSSSRALSSFSDMMAWL